jgi:Ku protein
MRSNGSVTLTLGPIVCPAQVCVGTQKGDHDVTFDRVSSITKRKFKRKEIDDEGNVLGEAKDGVECKAEYGVLNDNGFTKIDEDEIGAIEEAGKVDVLKLQAYDAHQIPVELYRGFDYLQPQKGAEDTFALIYRTLRETGAVGVCMHTPRTKQRILVVRPLPERQALIASELYFADEVRQPDEQVTGPVQRPIDEDLLSLAKELVNRTMQSEFIHGMYEDSTIEKRRKLIADALKGQPIAAIEAPKPPEHPAAGLMDSLKQELGL